MDVASLDVVEDAHEATFLRRLHSIRLQLAARTITDKISAYLLSHITLSPTDGCPSRTARNSHLTLTLAPDSADETNMLPL